MDTKSKVRVKIRVKELCEGSDISAYELSKRIERVPSTLTAVIDGTNRGSLELAERICEQLDITDPRELFSIECVPA